jgi:hypothetical protein
MLQKEVLIEEKKLHAGVGEHIGYELGAKMVKDYSEKHNEFGSHFVGRNILEQILAQPGCIGIKIYKGLNEEGVQKYVLTGADEKGNDIFEVTIVSPKGELQQQEGIVADREFERLGWFSII